MIFSKMKQKNDYKLDQQYSSIRWELGSSDVSLKKKMWKKDFLLSFQSKDYQSF